MIHGLDKRHRAHLKTRQLRGILAEDLTNEAGQVITCLALQFGRVPKATDKSIEAHQNH